MLNLSNKICLILFFRHSAGANFGKPLYVWSLITKFWPSYLFSTSYHIFWDQFEYGLVILLNFVLVILNRKLWNLSKNLFPNKGGDCCTRHQNLMCAWSFCLIARMVYGMNKRLYITGVSLWKLLLILFWLAPY